mgnify:CR=1 FL=1
MFALTQRMGSRIKSGSLDGFFVWDKIILFQHITNPYLLFFRQADIQKKNAWRTDGYPKKFVYQICFCEYPPSQGYATRKSSAVIIFLFHCLQGAILPALRPPTQKSFSPGARWGIALTPRAMPLFTIGRNTISKRLNDVSMGPSLDKTNASTAQGNKLYGGTSTLPYCTSTIADADMLQCVFILAPSSWGHDEPDYSPHVTTYPSLWYSSLRSVVASPPFCEDFLRGHFESTCWSIFLSVHFVCPYSYISKNTQRYSDSMFIRWMFFLIL